MRPDRVPADPPRNQLGLLPIIHEIFGQESFGPKGSVEKGIDYCLFIPVGPTQQIYPALATS
jgi:hypothetical protein